MEGKTQLTKFTFYDLYAELMDTLKDEEHGEQNGKQMTSKVQQLVV